MHDLQPRDSAGSSQSGSTREEVVESAVEDLTDKLPDPFNMIELHQKEETKTPYTVVCLQECERMNSLTQGVYKSLNTFSSFLSEQSYSARLRMNEQQIMHQQFFNNSNQKF